MAKKLKANSVSGYSNDSNPFGDPNLTEKYVNSFLHSYEIVQKFSTSCCLGKVFGLEFAQTRVFLGGKKTLK